MTALENAFEEWTKLLGAAQVLNGEAAQRERGQDASGIERRLPGLLKITAADTIPDVMKIANRHDIPVYPFSTGFNWGYGSALPVKDDCVLLDLSGMRQIIDFDAELGVVTLEPGVTQAQLAEFLDAGNHPFLVPVTGAGPQCSLIGNALERGYGVTPIVDHFGAVTDLEAVLADGSVYRTALREAAGDELARLFKWGIGPYSAGLFTQGNFGIVTRMTLILARRPECVKVCLFSLKDDALLEPAVEAIRSILANLPGTVGAINLMNQHRVLAMSAPFPRDQLDAEGLIPKSLIQSLGRQYQIFPWTGFGTLYGTKRVVKAAQKEIRQRLSGIASRLMFLTPDNAKTLAKLTRLIPGPIGQKLSGSTAMLAKSLELVAGRPNETALPLTYWRNPNPPKGALMNPSTDGCGLIWYAPLVPMRAKSVRSYVEMIHTVAHEYRIEPLITFTTVSDKIFDSTVPLIFERANPEAVRAATDCYGALLKQGREIGCFPYRVSVDTMAKLVDMESNARNFHQTIKMALDPSDLIAPGRYVPTLPR